MSSMMTFRLIVFFISLLILTFEWILYRRWKGRFGDRRWFRYARIVYWGIVLVTQAFLWMWIAGIRMTTPISGPGYVVYSFILAWQYNHLLLFPLFGIFILIGFLIRKSTAAILSRIRRGPDEAVESHPVQKSAELKNDRAAGKNPERKGLSRGDFLKRMTFAGGVVLDSVPLIGTAAVVSGIFLGSKDVVVERRQFRIRDLHPDLQGLRIVQVSDIHVGTLIHDEYLSKCVEIIRGLRADMLIATGDIIDNNNYFIPVAGRFFRPLVDALPMGAYGIPGNHDHIDNGAVAVSGLRSSGLRMLV
ncbi:MAG: metallophosphoesterase, partial [Leptospiraceae bacterium]|nr:metallophosphoesterase [Leptospiraceae bacterium]